MDNKNPIINRISFIIALGTAIITLLAFLFGDNIIGRICSDTTEATVITEEPSTTEPYNAESMCTVPDVIGYEQTVAIAIIENASLDATVEVSEENISDNDYYVIKQSIPAGTIVPIGTTITMELAPKQ